MKKILAWFLVMAAILSLLTAAAGCSTADAGRSDDASDPIVIWHDKEDEVAAALQKELSRLLPDMEIVLEKKTSLTDSLKLVGNDPKAAPDLFIFAHDKIGVFMEMGILAPVTDFVSQETLDDYLDMTLQAVTYKGELYQLPIYFETLLFMYNRRYMQDQEVPATTEELYHYMQANTGRGRYGFVEQHSTAYYSAAWIHGFAGSLISQDGTAQLDSEAVKKALTYHKKFVELMPGETEYSTVNTLFVEGKADATIGGPWMVPSAREAGIDLGIAAMPTVDETGLPLSPYSGVQGVYVLKHAAQSREEAVRRVLEAMSEPSVGVALAQASGCAPANECCYEDPTVAEDEMVQAMRRTAEIATPMPNIPEMDVMWTVAGNLLSDVNLSGEDIDTAAQSAQKKAEELIEAMH